MEKTIITGNVGKDAELSEFNGRFVLNFPVAVNRSYKDADGTTVKKTHWYSCAFWGNKKPGIAPFIKKGITVLVEGTLEPVIYTSKQDGKPMIDLRLNANLVEPMTWPDKEETENSNSQPQNKEQPAPAGFLDEGEDDDLPL